jgi:hypothetical protein
MNVTPSFSVIFQDFTVDKYLPSFLLFTQKQIICSFYKIPALYSIREPAASSVHFYTMPLSQPFDITPNCIFVSKFFTYYVRNFDVTFQRPLFRRKKKGNVIYEYL